MSNCKHSASVGLTWAMRNGEQPLVYPEQEGLSGDQVRCLDCKAVFESDGHMYADARGEVYEPPVCMEEGPDCGGTVEYRYALSGTGKSYPRCDRHWERRLDIQDGINRRYPTHQPSDFDPSYAGEVWGEDDY